MAVKIGVDFVPLTSDAIGEIKGLVERHGGHIIRYELNGPAGGNPYAAASFPTEAQARAFFKECFEGNEDMDYDLHVEVI